MNADLWVFWIAAPVSVLSGAAMILSRNAVHSALWLIVNFFTLSVFFLVLGSPFLFVVQIIVYAGAIMVLFLFVIMLLGVDRETSLRETIAGQRWIAAALAVGLVLEVFFAVRLGVGLDRGTVPDLAALNQGGNVQGLARLLFGPYFFPFEVTSVLLVIAAIGAMLHGRRRADEEETIDLDETGAVVEPVYGGGASPVAGGPEEPEPEPAERVAAR